MNVARNGAASLRFFLGRPLIRPLAFGMICGECTDVLRCSVARFLVSRLWARHRTGRCGDPKTLTWPVVRLVTDAGRLLCDLKA